MSPSKTKSGNVQFQVALTTVDVVIFSIGSLPAIRSSPTDNHLQVLLIRRRGEPARGQWALPGGFIDRNVDRDLSDAARRKLREKTGVDSSHLEQVISVGNASRDPRGWSLTVVYMALISDDEVTLDSESELLQWVPVDKALRKPLAFDHRNLLRQCHQRLMDKVEYTALPLNLMPSSFTLSELQQVYEVLLGKTLEKKAFRRRILDAGILQDTGSVRKARNRPARLYSATRKGGDHYFSRNLQGSR